MLTNSREIIKRLDKVVGSMCAPMVRIMSSNPLQLVLRLSFRIRRKT